MRIVDDNKNSVFKHDRFLMSFQVFKSYIRNRSCLNTEFSLSSSILTCSCIYIYIYIERERERENKQTEFKPLPTSETYMGVARNLKER